MNSVEGAYRIIADNLAIRANEGWMVLVFETAILRHNCSSMTAMEVTACNEKRSLSLGMAGAFAIDDACLYLREYLLKTTGQRIWGLIFTLQSDGTFQVEYNYNKPEDYEETEETIEVDASKSILKS